MADLLSTQPIIECMKTTRPLANGMLTTNLQQQTMANGTTQVTLKLRFIRETDKKAYTSVHGHSELQSIVAIRNETPEIKKWLSNVMAIPLSKECVLVCVYDSRYTDKQPMTFTLVEDAPSPAPALVGKVATPSSSFIEDKKEIYELTTRLSALTAAHEQAIKKMQTEADIKCAQLAAELESSKQECAKIQATLGRYLSGDPELGPIVAEFNEKMNALGIHPDEIYRELVASAEVTFRAKLEQLAGRSNQVVAGPVDDEAGPVEPSGKRQRAE